MLPRVRARTLPLDNEYRCMPFNYEKGKCVLMDNESLKVAACLIEQAPEILHRWERRVRAEIPGSRAQLPLALRNNLGPLLIEVARALCPTGEQPTLIAGLTLSQDHGSHRAKLVEYRIGEVFLE